MKATKIIVASLLVIAAIAYAAKTPQVFCEGLEGFSKPVVTPVVTVDETGCTIVDFGTQLGDKGQVQFTTANGNIFVKAAAGKAIAQKGGKVTGTINGVEAGFNGVALKLKGITVGTVVAAGLKSAQVANITGSVDAGNFAKGTAVKATTKVEGTFKGVFKSIQAGQFGEVEGTGITTPKKVAFKAKQAGGTIVVTPGLVYTAKNVNVVNPVTE
ncbi:hypothetical protein J5754_05990 [bacterium]|nr:hypothetical protein [bacterium]